MAWSEIVKGKNLTKLHDMIREVEENRKVSLSGTHICFFHRWMYVGPNKQWFGEQERRCLKCGKRQVRASHYFYGSWWSTITPHFDWEGFGIMVCIGAFFAIAMAALLLFFSRL